VSPISILTILYVDCIQYILHACDIMEDVAIGYGFNSIPRITPSTVTAGKPQPLSKLSDLLRDEVAHAGYTEVLTWCLVLLCFSAAVIYSLFTTVF
jgi:hypothetical protein